MMIMKMLGKIALAALYVSYLFASAAFADDDMFKLFRARAWKAMDAATAKTPRDFSLMANALRLQNRLGEAVAVLEKHSASFPSEIRPYADMTELLCREKLGMDTLALATRLDGDAALPSGLRYPAAYARLRALERSPASVDIEPALNRMLDVADTDANRLTALARLVKLADSPRRGAYALALLRIRPEDKTARALAAELAVPPKSTEWREVAYYKAQALRAKKRYSEALNLWGAVALSGNGPAERAVRRIASLASTPVRQDAVNALRLVAERRRGKVQARAMLSLMELVGEDEAKKLEEKLIKAYPDHPDVTNILWKSGWAAWTANHAPRAASLWRTARAPGISAAWDTKLLYWLAKASQSMKKQDDADALRAELLAKHPLSIYAFLLRPGRPKIADGHDPTLSSEAPLLERWGFVSYAAMGLRRPEATARELYRSMLLYEWLGNGDTTYSLARTLSRRLTVPALYRAGLERLYPRPRPFAKQVAAACAKQGVKESLVWAVMRQESSFRSGAVSHAGASGLMQLMPGTAKDEAKRLGMAKYRIFDPSDNIAMGVSHLAHLSRSFALPEQVMAAYNAGPVNARKWLAQSGELPLDRWIEAIGFRETRHYVQSVSGNVETYRALYGD
ncbi:MAG: lytic transglycosylase domain-containing protein [Synergistaceae bacterium]|jgi:soluble lytic murein transglycosylase|nr:lytic transglycosylase domain-containing protein [Synergistaceae bacterium]